MEKITERSRHFRAAVFICVCALTALAWLHSTGYFYSTAEEEKIKTKIEMFPSRLLKCPEGAVLCGGEEFGKFANLSDFNTLRSEFYRLMTTMDFECPSTLFDQVGGGDHKECMARVIRPNNNSCLVYSFGISNNWRFDEAWAKYGCEVHSFDPSIRKPDHMHAPNVSFHNLGLWGSDYTNSKGWKLERLSTIKKRLGHEERIIDVLKIDAEGAEWPFLRDVIYSDPYGLSNVRQLYFELHTPRFIGEKNMTATDFAEINDYVRRLRDDLDFKLFHNAHDENCCGGFNSLMPPGVPEKCCHEVSFFNPHLLTI